MRREGLVSVIVPVYNVERYLAICIDSILTQSYDNLEVLLVDDGSSDSSGSICDKYAQSDKRVKVIHKENGGQSSARNIGMENARQYFERKEGVRISPPKVNIKIDKLLREFILSGGFEL